jgi:hypothetical protein
MRGKISSQQWDRTNNKALITNRESTPTAANSAVLALPRR